MAHPAYRLTQAGLHLDRHASMHTAAGSDDPLAEHDRLLRLDTEPQPPQQQQTTQPPQREQQQEEEQKQSSTAGAVPAVIWHDRQRRPQIKGAATAAASTSPSPPAVSPSTASLLLLPPSSSAIASAHSNMSARELAAPLLPSEPVLSTAVSSSSSVPSSDVLIGIGSDGGGMFGSVPSRSRRVHRPTASEEAKAEMVSAAETFPTARRRTSSSSSSGRRPSHSSRRTAKADTADSGEGRDVDKEWLRALRQREKGLQTDEENKQREQRQQAEDDEADEEEEEDDEEGQRSDDSSSSSSSDSSGSGAEDEDDEHDEGGEAGKAASKALPPIRRSAAPDDALRITIIGELVSRESKLRPFTTSPPFPIQTQQPAAQSVAADQQQQQPQQQLSQSSPASTGRSVAPLVNSQPSMQSAATSTPASSGSSTPPTASAATATISPPFPAPPIVRAAPPVSTAASTPAVSSLPSPGRLLSRLASGELVGSCRVFHGVEALIRSRYDSNYDRPDQPVWISVENADNATIEVIGSHFDLHPLTVEDVQSKHTREKLEIFQHYLFLVFHSLQHTDSTARERRTRRAAKRKRRRRRRRQQQQQRRSRQVEGGRTSGDESEQREEDDEGEWSDDDDRELHTEAESESMRTVGIKLIVFPHLVLSFTTGLRFPTLLAVRHRLRKVYDNRLESTAWIIHAMLDSIVDALLPVVDGTVVEVDALEDLIYVLSGSEHRDLLKRMGLTRRRLSFLRQRLWSKRDILMSLIGKDWQLFLAGVQIPYLRDVYDHVVTMLVSRQLQAMRYTVSRTAARPLPSERLALTVLCCAAVAVLCVCSTRWRLRVSCWPVCRTRTWPTCLSTWPSSPSSPTRS